MDKRQKFYTSDKWRSFSRLLKMQSQGICNRCNRYIDTYTELIAHHRIELTEENVENLEISMNEEFIEIICFECHNKEHRRFGYQKQVYLVWGSPFAGKNEYVREISREGDIILDLNELWKAISLAPNRQNVKALKSNIFELRNNLLDQIKRRYGQWSDAYVIGGYPETYERERIAKELGAKQIYIESTEEGCLMKAGKTQNGSVQQGYVKEWWKKFRQSAPPSELS